MSHGLLKIKLPVLALAGQLDRRMFVYNFIQGIDLPPVLFP